MRDRPPFTIRLLPLLVAAAVLLQPAAPLARAADAGLVLEALGAVRSRYVDPVDSVAMLNDALTGLRRALADTGVQVELAPVPAATPVSAAERLFRERFEVAAAEGRGRVTMTALAYAAIRAMTARLNDSHTGFVTPEANRERQLRQRGQAGFSGIGVVLMPRDGRFYVRDLIPGGPALSAGVRPLDRIARIDKTPVGGLRVDEVAGMIRGPEGTPVVIGVERPGRSAPLVITVTRRPIQVPSIFQARVADGGVGYLQLYQFVAGTGRDVRGALDGMLKTGMRALVLDLRANNGGYLHELTIALNAMLPRGRPIFQETSRGGQQRTVRTPGVPVLPQGFPMIVLVDEATASAAELMAAALREQAGAVLVGVKTSGAVEASVLVDLSDGSAVSVTIQRLASGLGRRLEGRGVTPDVQVELVVEDLDQGRDAQLARAIRLARQRLGHSGLSWHSPRAAEAIR
jgi:carboxyl-terminal processing protease